MRCTEAQEQLVAAHDGELGPSAVAVLEEHLRECPSCRRWDQELRGLSLGGRLRVPRDVWVELEARTDSDRLVQVEPVRRRNPGWRFALAAAAVLLAGLGVGHRLGDRAAPAPTVVHAPIPAEQWQPAAFRAGPDDVPVFDTNVLHLPATSTDGVTR